MPIYPREALNLFPKNKTIGKCFVLMPFADNFRHVYESIYNACRLPEVLLPCSRADDFFGGGSIMESILEGIISSEYIIADLTSKNPNVFYELGIAHSSKDASKVIIISQSLDDIPFDLRHMRCILYENDSNGLRKLTNDLEKVLRPSAQGVYRFEIDGKGPFMFDHRLSGNNQNFYRFTLGDLYTNEESVKFSIVVHRESLDEGNETLQKEFYYVEIGKFVKIPPTYWRIRLDRVLRGKAYFTVEPT
jgi:hypothetical protein